VERRQFLVRCSVAEPAGASCTGPPASSTHAPRSLQPLRPGQHRRYGGPRRWSVRLCSTTTTDDLVVVVLAAGTAAPVVVSNSVRPSRRRVDRRALIDFSFESTLFRPLLSPTPRSARSSRSPGPPRRRRRAGETRSSGSQQQPPQAARRRNGIVLVVFGGRWWWRSRRRFR
jgi:hypothetical protein